MEEVESGGSERSFASRNSTAKLGSVLPVLGLALWNRFPMDGASPGPTLRERVHDSILLLLHNQYSSSL